MKSLKQVGMFAAVAALSTVAIAQAHTHQNGKYCDFIPENTLRVPEGLESAGGLDRAAFDRVIDKVENFYTPVVKAKGGKFIVKRLWSKSDSFKGQDGETVNAFALQEGKNWYVAMFGGLARRPETTEDGFMLVICHEVGHHLGGYPKSKKSFFGGDSWASVEGQADYFATMKCAREIWKNDDNVSIVASLNVPKIVKDKCALQHKSADEIAICERGAMAGMDLATLLYNLSQGSKKSAQKTGLENIAGSAKPAFETPDMTQVSETLGVRNNPMQDPHPKAQCRLDTYFDGAVCGVASSEEFGEKDAVTGACAEEKGDKLGFRSRCWYKPSTKF